MSDALAQVQSNYIPIVSAEDEQLIKELAPSKQFLPRINLLQSTSGDATGRNAKFKGGDLVLYSGKEGQLLGESFNFLAYSFRHKSVEIIDGEGFSFYKPGTPDFERIRAKAAEGGMNGSMYGIEFLVYLTSTGQFATFYFNNTTLKNSVETVVGMMKQGRHIKCKNDYIEGKSHKWWGAKFDINPVAPEIQPSIDEIEEQIKTFKEAKDSDVKKVEEVAGAESDRVR